MKLIRGALSGAAALVLVVAPTVATAGTASKLSLRASTSAKKSSKAVPHIPTWLAATLVAGVVVGTVVVATQKPDSL
jgi:broad specificity polyphosphatase/5'/3'-nucleotidase SurE